MRGDVGVDPGPGQVPRVPRPTLRLPEADETEESVAAPPDCQEAAATVALAAV